MKSRVLFAHRARRIFFFVHLWTGLILGLWFALLGITGSVLAWRFDLSAAELAWRYPVEKSANSTMIPLSQAVSAMKAAQPEATARELSNVTLPNSKSRFYNFSRGRNRATQQTYLVDPYSARVHGPIKMRELTVGTIQQFHQRLLAGGRGYLINGLLNFLAIPLLLSGLWLWWPTKWKHLKAHLTIKRGVSFKRTIYDLHNVMGIYLYGVLFVTTLTGFLLVKQHIDADGGIANFLAEQNAPPAREGAGQPRGEGQLRGGEGRGEARGGERTGERGAQGGNARAGGAREGGGRGEPEAPKIVAQGTRLSDDEVIARAKAARPGNELTRVRVPQKPDEPFQLTYARPVGITLNETTFFDPYAGKLLDVPAPAGPNASPVRTWTKALHLGEFGGVTTKLLYTITGLLPLGLFVTGFLLWFRKKVRKKATA